MLNIPDHKGNASQIKNEISPHSSQNGCHQEHKQQKMLARICGEKELLYSVRSYIN
jgi:hypothetical protein